MELPQNKESNIELAYDLISGIKQDNFQYIYRGIINSETLVNILSIAEKSLIKAEDTKKIKKRLYYIIFEALQNITRHQKNNVDGSLNEAGLFLLQKNDYCYSITTANIIELKDIGKLTKLIDKLNSFEDEELKNVYTATLTNGKLSSKGGAGLGLITIMRKTNTKLKYEFSNLGNETAFFYLRNEIILNEKSENKEQEQKDEWHQTITLHKTLIENNILLNFNGRFDHDNMLNLIQIIQKQIIHTNNIKEKVMKIMVEMLRNIVKFADGDEYLHYSEEFGNPGIFFIGNSTKNFILNAGNYIRNSSIDILKSKIDFVNGLEQKKLLEFHKNLTVFFENGTINKPDLSILEMKLLSKRKLMYDFKKVNDNFSFFVIQVII